MSERVIRRRSREQWTLILQRYRTPADPPQRHSAGRRFLGPVVRAVCKMMAPVFERAAAQMEPRVRFAKVNTDQEQNLAARFSIRSIPTVALFRDGREAARQAGAMDGQRLAAWIDQQLG